MTGNGDAEASHQAAALDNTSESRMTASLVSSLGEKVATAHPLVATKPEHLATKLVLTWSTFKMSGAKDKSLIDMMLATMEDCRVDLKYGLQTGTDAEIAFFDFSSEFTRAQSDELHEEVALGKATDIATATSLFDQVCALHAVQYAIIARTAAESNEDIIPLIDKMLQAIESSNP
ncbi:hypothetical protein H9Q70_005035 [Fusarium xylarioides]|nr:hypothetical protein H9Q70_005035 [Fusarium xylarioides]KAG5783919.1 hypothetical protein H9Q73_002419 [Fusarium xylarioides]